MSNRNILWSLRVRKEFFSSLLRDSRNRLFTSCSEEGAMSNVDPKKQASKADSTQTDDFRIEPLSDEELEDVAGGGCSLSACSGAS